MTSAQRRAWAWAVGTLLLATGCTRAVDESRLTKDVQGRLDRELAPDLFDVVALQREGSAPLPTGESGAARVIVYFNASLKLARDYTFGGWDQLAASSVAYALGATDKGVFGLQATNRAGEMVRAYGSAIYEETKDGWVAVAGAPAATASAKPNLDATGPSLRSKQLIDALAEKVNLPPPGVTPQDDEILAEELARASENIERRMQRRAHTFTLATGADGSEYARFGQAFIEAITAAAPAVKLRQRTSEGSVDNAQLLARGEADYALIQADVAAAAVAGEDVFARGGPLVSLRAVGGLFPEAVHIVVPANSPVREVGDLRGHRVAIGAPNSGTRFDALAVLEAHGLAVTDLAEARGDATAAALERLKRGQVHAVFLTTLAPTRALQQLAVSPGLRLIPVAAGAMRAAARAAPRAHAVDTAAEYVSAPAGARRHGCISGVAGHHGRCAGCGGRGRRRSVVQEHGREVCHKRRSDPGIAAERTPRRDDSATPRRGSTLLVVKAWRVVPFLVP